MALSRTPAALFDADDKGLVLAAVWGAGVFVWVFAWVYVYKANTPDGHPAARSRARFGSAPGIEEGGPRLSASLQPGDPLPRPTTSQMFWWGQTQSVGGGRAGSRVEVENNDKEGWEASVGRGRMGRTDVGRRRGCVWWRAEGPVAASKGWHYVGDGGRWAGAGVGAAGAGRAGKSAVIEVG